MATDELTGIIAGSLVRLLVARAVQQQVVAHTAADEALLDTGQGIDRMVDVEQLRMVGIQIGADTRMDARRTLALGTGVLVFAVHAIHIGRWSAEV